MDSFSKEGCVRTEKPVGFSASFHWLNATQFLGALNDNVFKLFVIFFLISVLGGQSANDVVFKAGAFFALPFLIFTPWAGWLADRYSKRTIIVTAKVLEMVVMAVGLAGFYLRRPDVLYAALFLMSAHSSLFSPSKYGIIPELVPRDQLSRANGLLVMLTYVAIILGTALAPWSANLVGLDYRHAQWICVGIAVLGWLCSTRMGPTPRGESTRRFPIWFLKDLAVTIWSIRKDRFLLLAVIASGYFMLLGAYLQLNMIPYGMQHLQWTQEKSGYLFFFAAVGIALGALLAGRLSGRNIEFGIVPIGALLLAMSVTALRFVPAVPWQIAAWVFVAGIGAGLFIIPVDAFIQFRAPRERMGEILAAAGFLGWVGVILAAILVKLNSVLNLTAGEGFVLMGGLTFGLTLVAFWTLPDFFIRFMVLIVTRSYCRVRVEGGERMPLEGGALLVSNPVSPFEAARLVATTQRRIRFLVDPAFVTGGMGAKLILQGMGVISISMGDTPRHQVMAVQSARAALDEGYLVCIFAGSDSAEAGAFDRFQTVFTRLAEGTASPVLRVHIGKEQQGEGSSRHWGRVPVTVRVEEPENVNTTAREIWDKSG
jgi:acyl-[acyl-carrier-protein]-phospholipid O-acyltransferase/long-chain-fatty-acid--[acyl-carrier-protein] ligase